MILLKIIINLKILRMYTMRKHFIDNIRWATVLLVLVYHVFYLYNSVGVFGGGLDSIPPALIYPISVLSGIGPLWFIQMLYLFSLLLVLIRKLDSKDRLYELGKKCTKTHSCDSLFFIWNSKQKKGRLKSTFFYTLIFMTFLTPQPLLPYLV